MADDSSKTSTQKTKRRLRAAPTLREQAEKQTIKNEKSVNTPSRRSRFFKSPVFAPFRFIGRVIRAIWMSSLMRPIRFIVRIIGKVVWPQYFRNSFKELKQVTWPDFRTTWRLTGAVIVFGTIFGLAIYGLDIVLEKLLREVLLG